MQCFFGYPRGLGLPYLGLGRRHLHDSYSFESFVEGQAYVVDSGQRSVILFDFVGDTIRFAPVSDTQLGVPLHALADCRRLDFVSTVRGPGSPATRRLRNWGEGSERVRPMTHRGSGFLLGVFRNGFGIVLDDPMRSIRKKAKLRSAPNLQGEGKSIYLAPGRVSKSKTGTYPGSLPGVGSALTKRL